jgi:hypothetical protein
LANTQGSVLPALAETSQGPAEESTPRKVHGYQKGLEGVASLDARLDEVQRSNTTTRR